MEKKKEESSVREIAVPGEVIGKKGEAIPGYGTYEEDNNVFSKFLGIVSRSNNYLSVVPLSGVYIPKIGENVIGEVQEIEKVGWTVDINCPWPAFLSVSESVDEFVDIKKTMLNRFFDSGDVVYAQIVGVKNGDVQLSMRQPTSKKLKDGVLVTITPSKVPRLIGKEGSMVNMIKDKTKTIIRVGQNGVVWVAGEEIDKAIMAIKMIDEKSHIYGLTDEISKLLSE